MSIRRPYKWLGAQRYGYENNRANQLLTFKAFASPSCVANLDSDLTINGSTVTASYVYYGGDASASGWSPRVGGETLALQAGTAPTYNDGSPLLGTDDDSVKFNGGGYFKDALNTAGDITTEDFVVECIFKFDITNNAILFQKSTGSNGYAIYALSTLLRLLLGDGTTITIPSAVLTDNVWYHAIGFVNRDEASTNGAKWYINGVASGTGTDVSARSGSLTNTEGLQIGNATISKNVAYCAMWKKASWHQAGAAGPAEWATIAATRFAQLQGTYPQVAKGTALPTTSTRAYPAYLDKMEDSNTTRKLYQVGSEWMRMCSRISASGEYMFGYLPEPQATNNFTYSEQFDNAAWTKSEATISADAIVAPNKETTADGIIASVTAETLHFVSQNVTTSSAGNDVYSVFCKKGNKDWVYLVCGTINAYCYFDLANGVKGLENNATGYIEDFGDDWYRCIISFTGDGTSRPCRIYPADGNGDITFTGDGSTVNTYVWGAQHETTGLGYATSYTPTTSAAATRLKDQLEYVAGDNIGGKDVGQGTIACSVLFPDYDMLQNARIISLNDGGSVADKVDMFVLASGDVLDCITRASGGNNGDVAVGGVDISNNEIRSLRMFYETNNVLCSVDSTKSNADTSCDMPDDLDNIYIGSAAGALTQQPACLLSNIRIYKEPTEGGS